MTRNLDSLDVKPLVAGTANKPFFSRPRNEPVCHYEEHICGCTAEGCKCKVMTTHPVCTLCSNGDHTRF